MAAKKKAVKKKAVKKTAKAKTTSKKKAATKKKKAVAKKSAKKAVKKAAPKAKTKTVKKKAAKKAAPTAKAKAKPKAKTAAKPKKSKPAAKPSKKSASTGDALEYTDFTPYEMKKGEDYMNAEQVEHFRELLKAANFPDPNDRATQESDFTMELRTRDRERKLIKKIEESLNLLDNDEYGYCESCGIEIGVRRLEARPTATECIDCKTLNEIKEKQYGK